jgi:hypothetical protein
MRSWAYEALLKITTGNRVRSARRGCGGSNADHLHPKREENTPKERKGMKTLGTIVQYIMVYH